VSMEQLWYSKARETRCYILSSAQTFGGGARSSRNAFRSRALVAYQDLPEHLKSGEEGAELITNSGGVCTAQRASAGGVRVYQPGPTSTGYHG
jgi:hypothetical protein